MRTSKRRARSTSAAIRKTPIAKHAAQVRREKITAAGGRQLNVLLKPAPNRALIRLMKHHKLPAVQVISLLLTDAAAQLRKPGGTEKSPAASAMRKPRQRQRDK